MEKTIYIIEDDSNILYGLQARFSSEGYQVELNEGQENVEEILSNIKETKPTQVILDLILPDIDGFEIIERIKSDEDLSEIPIFVFTDISDQDSKSRSLELGADYYFIKADFDVNEFADKVIRIMGNQEGM